MINESKIIEKSISHLYENTLNSSRDEYNYFFKRPLIRKGYLTLLSIWKNGGKNNDSKCKREFLNKKKDLYFLVVDILNDEKYHMFLKLKNWNNDLPKEVLRSFYFIFKGYGKNKESLKDEEIDPLILNQLYNDLNSNYFQLFFKSIIEFKKTVLKKEKNNGDTEIKNASWNETYLQ